MTLFESLAYDEFDTPLDSVDDLAHFILNYENDGLVFKALRAEIAVNAIREDQAVTEGHTWSMTIIGILRGMPEARALFAQAHIQYEAIATGCRILDRAAAILRGAA